MGWDGGGAKRFPIGYAVWTWRINNLYMSCICVRLCLRRQTELA